MAPKLCKWCAKQTKALKTLKNGDFTDFPTLGAIGKNYHLSIIVPAEFAALRPSVSLLEPR